MLELRILTGLHRGAAAPLEGDTIRLGSGTENDIVLLDPGMPEHAGALARDGQSHWRFRPGGPPRARNGSTAHAASQPEDTAIVDGTRWFAGPVLLGCAEEGAPWPVEPIPPSMQSSAIRHMSARAKAIVATTATIAFAGLIAALAMLAMRTEPTRTSRASAATPPTAGTVNSQERRERLEPHAPPDQREQRTSAQTPIRVAKGIVYPSGAVARPPFAIRSAKGGPHGFLVTDDDHILVPGSRWKGFTLVRIESGRAVFSGPHAAEVKW